MLIISRSEGTDLTQTLKVEGKLMGPWVGELESVFGVCRGGMGRVELDLGGLSFVDAEGAQCLAGLIRDGARVVAWSGYVAELLRLERPR